MADSLGDILRIAWIPFFSYLKYTSLLRKVNSFYAIHFIII